MRKTRFWLGVSMTAIVIGCGGSTTDSSSNNGSGAAGGAAGSGGNAGSSGAGGTGGGSSGTGGTSGSAGSAGTAGTAGADCNAPPESRSCEGGDRTYYFDRASAVCKAYGDRCSNDSRNRFQSLADCMSTCGGRPDVDVCDDASECAIVDAGCCAACEPIGSGSLLSVNRARIGDFRGGPCPPIACGACPPVDELATNRQYFVPSCPAGRCSMFDIRNTAYTQCNTDADCVLRDGANCCEGCDGSGLVSLKKDQSLAPLCGSENVGCPACVPIIPPEYASYCSDLGYCRVIRRTN